MIMQIMINLLQILIWPIGPCKMYFHQISSYLGQRKKSYRPKQLDEFFLCNMGKWGALCLPTWLPQYKYMEMFLNFESTHEIIGISN